MRLTYRIQSLDDASNLARLCGKYADTGLEIDVGYGRYVIDGFSTLGIFSLIGHTVSIELRATDGELIDMFEKDFWDMEARVED